MRILGITIPEEKRIEIWLTTLSVEQENAIRKIIEQYKIEGDLKREVAGNIKHLKDIKSYRGSRHARNLPSRGQRTKTNARTLRGKKKTMSTGRKIADKK